MSYPEAEQYRAQNEDTVLGLLDELHRLQDAVQAVDLTNPAAEAIIEHLEDLILWCEGEVRLAGEEV